MLKYMKSVLKRQVIEVRPSLAGLGTPPRLDDLLQLLLQAKHPTAEQMPHLGEAVSFHG